MGSSILRKSRKARNSMPAKINGAGGSETEASGSRASTPKSTRSDRNFKNLVRNGLTRLNSRPQRSRNVEAAISTPNQVVDSPTSLIHDSQDSAMFEADDSAGSMGYESEVYHFGLDGAGSPDSNATGNRVSTRARKPTARALESQASELRMRRKNTPKPIVTPVHAAGEFSTGKQTEAPRPRPVHPRILKLARNFYALAAAAVSEEYTPQQDARALLEKLRAEFYQKQQEDGKHPFSFGVENALVVRDDVVSISSDCEIYRPTNTYGDKQLPQPPVRVRSQGQAEKERIFGFPPQAGQKNAPLQAPNSPFMAENVGAIIDKMKLREEALSRGISVDRNTPALEIASMIDKKDPDQAPVKLRFPNAFPQDFEGPVQGHSKEAVQGLDDGPTGEASKEPTKPPRKKATKQPKKEVTKEPTKAPMKLPAKEATKEPVKTSDLQTQIREPSPPRKGRRGKATTEETGQGGEQVLKRRQTKPPATPEQSSNGNDNTQAASTDEKSKAKRRRADTPVQPTEEEREPASKRRRTKAAQAAEAEVQNNKGASAADEPKVEESRTKRRRKTASQTTEQGALNESANAPLEFEFDESPAKKKRRVTPDPQEKKPRQRKKNTKAAAPQRLHLYIGGDKNRQQHESH